MASQGALSVVALVQFMSLADQGKRRSGAKALYISATYGTTKVVP